MPVQLPDEAPGTNWIRSIRLSGFAITALGLIVLCVVVLAPSLRVYIAQLRRKLEPDPSRPRHLLTEPGMGYRFEP